jgi:hypothetical protein
MRQAEWQGRIDEKLDRLDKQFSNHLQHHFMITSGCLVAAVGQILVIAWFIIQKVLGH